MVMLTLRAFFAGAAGWGSSSSLPPSCWQQQADWLSGAVAGHTGRPSSRGSGNGSSRGGQEAGGGRREEGRRGEAGDRRGHSATGEEEGGGGGGW